MAKTLKLIKLSIYEDVAQVESSETFAKNVKQYCWDGKRSVMRKAEGVPISLRIGDQRLTTVKDC